MRILCVSSPVLYYDSLRFALSWLRFFLLLVYLWMERDACLSLSLSHLLSSCLPVIHPWYKSSTSRFQNLPLLATPSFAPMWSFRNTILSAMQVLISLSDIVSFSWRPNSRLFCAALSDVWLYLRSSSCWGFGSAYLGFCHLLLGAGIIGECSSGTDTSEGHYPSSCCMRYSTRTHFFSPPTHVPYIILV